MDAHYTKAGRRWIRINIRHLGISLIEKRLKDAFPAILFKGHATSKDLAGAQDLAARDKYSFQWWALSPASAHSCGGKEGTAGGADSLICFRFGAMTTEGAIASVKGSGVSGSGSV